MTPADRVAKVEALVALFARMAAATRGLHEALVRLGEANEKLSRARQQ